MSKSGTARAALVGSLPSPPASLPTHKLADGIKQELNGSAIDDDSNDMSGDDDDKLQKARIRRASDGQPLTKDGKKSSRIEVRCEKCGKSYKHSSCLTKHLLVFHDPSQHPIPTGLSLVMQWTTLLNSPMESGYLLVDSGS